MATIEQARQAEPLIRDVYRIREMQRDLQTLLVTDQVTLRIIVRQYGNDPDRTLDLGVPAGIVRDYLAECLTRTTDTLRERFDIHASAPEVPAGTAEGEGRV